MKSLEQALSQWVQTHHQYKVSGQYIPVSPDTLQHQWPDTIPSSPELDYYLSHYEPSDVLVETGFAPIIFWSIDQLQQALIGYRWVGMSEPFTESDTWRADFVIIADDLGKGNPIIVATSEEGTPVYAGYDAGEPFLIAPTLADFFVAMSLLVEVVYGSFEIFEITDDDSVVLPAFEEQLKTAIEPILGAELFANFYDYFYG
ncbi:hypothetical protein PQ460_16220 [Paenibacillus sp. KACC 21273]|uniref:hypothetical protein n=1 Tax=Paenibacillus sp. KACC 21273 TaxID=3025665 RepID=UPI0023661E94|nr:hypothetical protein [Paenibacillus sp. KACC 21273]WDF49546.1 hypothetical protein PQ460_16220 [Paenibacillus sp. KACC 21273]